MAETTSANEISAQFCKTVRYAKQTKNKEEYSYQILVTFTKLIKFSCRDTVVDHLC
jgi:hypothetical protein